MNTNTPASSRKLTLDDIADLRAYEREYRLRLKQFIEAQLSEIDNNRVSPTPSIQTGPTVIPTNPSASISEY